MDIRYNKEKLSKILEDVYMLLQTPISIFDKDFRFLTSYPPEGYLTDFCHIIRESPERAEKCRHSDEESCRLCQSSGRTFSYLCHAGIRETITPIHFERLVIGYILFGEYRVHNECYDVTEYARQNGIEEKRLVSAYENLTVLTEEQVEATCNILKSCILQFWLSEAIFLKENELAASIKQYIDENLSEPLTAEQICKSFMISRGRLYQIFRENFNTSVKHYILEKKMERAKHLLLTTDHTVAEIALLVGFSDYNNFIQRFKKMTGMTPLKYRMMA